MPKAGWKEEVDHAGRAGGVRARPEELTLLPHEVSALVESLFVAPGLSWGDRRQAFNFCIPTRGTKVPHTPDWLHKIKYDGYRLRVERAAVRVRLFTRNGHDWTALSMDCRGCAEKPAQAIRDRW